MERPASKKPGGRHDFRALLRSLDAEQDAVEAAGPQALALAEASKKEQLVQRVAHARSVRAGTAGEAEGSERASVKNFGPLRLLQLGSNLQQRLADAVCHLSKAKAKVDESLQTIFRSVFTEQRHATSLSAEAQTQKTDRYVLKSSLQQAAAFIVLFTGYLIGLVLSALSALSHRPVLLVVKRSYDETPSKITASWLTPAEQGRARSKAEGTAKVLQTRMELAVMMEDNSGDFYSIRVAIPTWLQAVDRTTAETTKKCQETLLSVIPGLSEFGARCKFHVNLVATDKYAANLKAEQSLASSEENAASSHYTCDVHKIATCQSRTLAMVDGHVSAMIAASLCCTEAGSTRSLRESLSRVLKDRVQVCFGEPPTEHQAYRDAVFDAFLPDQGPQEGGEEAEDEEDLNSVPPEARRQCFLRRTCSF